MAMLLGFRVQNYRVLKKVTLGRLVNEQKDPPLTPLTAVIGKNGVGKSTLFDAFGYLADTLAVGVEEACDQKQRGGYSRLVSAGSKDPIRFEIYYRENQNERPITYELTIGPDRQGRPMVKEEKMRQGRKGPVGGQPFNFLNLEGGRGVAWSGKETLEGDEDASKVAVELTDPRKLGIATLGALKDHPRITRFRDFLSHWHLSYFTPDAARGLPTAGPQKHLNIHGDNLGNVVQYMEREHKEAFKRILSQIAEKIPGVHKIDARKTEDNRLLLRFNDKGFTDPFYAQQMSDGTLKLFAYLLLLEDPDPPPFLCIEEPENGLYHKLLDTLANEFRAHATGRKGSSQIFVTTHQPYLVDALKPEEVWILSKGEDGFSSISRATDDPIVKNMVEQGLPLGGLWYSDYLDPR
ncbi:MAG: AAA family ATPase [Magnetococcales bacterium]|nr:AAA family ATPase [Magnetococcales bacterium]